MASADDVSDWDGGRRLVEAAVEAFGDLHVLVNNAGNLRDGWLTEMTPTSGTTWSGSTCGATSSPLRWAAAHWKAQSEAGRPVQAAVVNTTSTSGLIGNPGQTNYGAAKAGIAALTVIAAAELAHFGVRVNAVAPLARTRMTESSPWLAAMVAPPADPDAFDAWHPANVSPVVAWLASEACTVTGEVFLVQGGTVQRFRPWTLDDDAKLVQDAPLDRRRPGRGHAGRPPRVRAARRCYSVMSRMRCWTVGGGGAVGRGQLLEGGQELGHLALDPHLAGHEGGHGRGDGAVDEHRLGRVVVEGDGDVGLLEVADVHLQRAGRWCRRGR